MSDIAAALMEMVENMKPIVEAAEGQKRALEERGWSPTAAEKYATELLVAMTRAAFKGTA